MPYVSAPARSRLGIDLVPSPATAGELNYSITRLLIQYLDIHGLSYDSCNDIVGALENAKDEFQRRVQHPYENKKIRQNSDVYPTEYTS